MQDNSSQSGQGSVSLVPQDLPTETPPVQTPSLAVQGSDQPVAVVQALSVKGVEYVLMTLSLWFGGGSLIWIALSLVNGMNSFSVLSFPLSVLLVSLPVFAFFFVRLRKAELADPKLKFDPSKRRVSQFTQVIAFAACMFNVIGFVFLLLQKAGGESTGSFGKSFLNLLVVLAVAGGIFAYYWFDEHRLLK